ncbi:MAG: hypothetical protein ACOC8L_01845 [Spirochaetota bacterium]
MGVKTHETYADRVQKQSIRMYLYLDLSTAELIEKMKSLSFSCIGENSHVPFNASVRGYKGAMDSDGDPWLIKPIDKKELVDHAYQEAAFYIDFALGTLAAPNIVKEIDGVPYRATKILGHALQISSYEYFNEPFKTILANDLVNRWMFFDEDRNPNNYLVMHDELQKPLIIVIDYNKADLRTPGMKITGNDDKFGWKRLEKTRFLTLLKPENFANLSIESFECRLDTLMALPRETLELIGTRTFSALSFTKDTAAEHTATLVTNIETRRSYINDYFRTWFKPFDAARQQSKDDRYAGMGQSFMDYYQKKM